MRTINGRSYVFEMPQDRTAWPYSGGMFSWDGATVPLRTHDELTVRSIIEDVYGATLDESYELNGGTLDIGAYQIRSDDEGENSIVLNTFSVAIWSKDGHALWTDTELQTSDWLIDLFDHLAPAVSNGCVVAMGAKPEAFDTESETLLVSIDGLGALNLMPRVDSPRRTPTRGAKVAAGELFRQVTAGTDIPPGIVLRSKSAIAQLTLLERSADDAATELSEFARLETSP